MKNLELENSNNSTLREKSPGSSGSNNYNKYLESKLKEYTVLNPYCGNQDSNMKEDRNIKNQLKNENLKQKSIRENIVLDNRVSSSNSDIESLRTLEKRYIELMNRFNKVSNQFQSLKTTNDIIEKENKYQAELHKRVVFDLQNEIDNLNISLHEK